jgi:uncharacterized protein (DUF58 family)
MLAAVLAWIRRLTVRRSTRLTPEGIRFLLFTLATGIAAVNTGNNLFYLLLAMMLSIILLSGIMAEQCVRRLEFHRHMPDLLSMNEPASATIVIKNGKGKLGSYSLRLYDVGPGGDIDRGLTVVKLPPGETRLLSYPIVGTTRGKLEWDGIRVATSFPFGLFTKKAYYPVYGSTVVAPAISPLDESVAQDLAGAGQDHAALHRRGHGSDLYNLRLYQSGDDSRSIHWVTTARTSKLIVRENAEDDSQTATVYLFTGASALHDARFEQAVAFTASLLAHLAERGYRFRLALDGSPGAFGTGHQHLCNTLRTLALCQRRDPSAGMPRTSGPALHQGEDDVALLIRHGDEEESRVRATIAFEVERIAHVS